MMVSGDVSDATEAKYKREGTAVKKDALTVEVDASDAQEWKKQRDESVGGRGYSSVIKDQRME
jgi:hypothetical protein